MLFSVSHHVSSEGHFLSISSQFSPSPSPSRALEELLSTPLSPRPWLPPGGLCRPLPAFPLLLALPPSSCTPPRVCIPSPSSPGKKKRPSLLPSSPPLWEEAKDDPSSRATSSAPSFYTKDLTKCRISLSTQPVPTISAAPTLPFPFTVNFTPNPVHG